MSNLLEKASILTTPTAYDNGKILSVKPSIVLGNELITNGDFSNGSTGWTVSNGTITDKYNASMTAYQTGIRILPFSNTGTFKVTFDLVVTSGSCKFDAGGVNNAIFNTSGTKEIIVTNTTKFEFNAFNLGWVGTLDNVSVKEKIGGDFDFTRNSSATRVNAQGLVEDVQILSSNLVSNGDFSQEGSELVTNGSFDTDSDWGTNDWNISGGSLNGSASTGIVFQNNLGVVVGKTYKVVLEISNYTSGLIRFKVGGASYQNIASEDGVQEFYFVAATTANNILFSVQSAYTGSIDNVSVKEVGQDWTFGTGWSIGDGEAIHTGDGDYIEQGSLTAGSKYKVVIDVTQASGSGFPQIYMGGLTTAMTSVDTYTFYITAQAGDTIKLRGVNDCKIGSISVIEITDDTNLPRINYTNFDYENGEIVPYSGEGSLLLEPQSTNTIISSNSGFLAFNMDLSYNNATSPDGTQNAFKATTTTASGSQFRPNQTITTPSTFSIFLKYGNNQWYQVINSSANSFYANIDVQNGVFGSSGSQTDNLSVKDYGNGWYRFSGTFTSASTNGSIRVYASSFPNAGWAGVSAPIGSYVYGYGFQVEASSFATSYIPTEGSIKTRLQDAAFGAGSSDLINSTEGVLYAEIAALADDLTNRSISLSDGSANNRVNILYSNSSNQIRVIILVGNSTKFDQNYNVTSITDMHKIAVKYKENDFALWVDGVERLTDTSGTIFAQDTLNELAFNVGGGILPFYGKVKSVAVFKEALTDEELTCLTTI